jgi:hypothetical protein
METIKRVLGVEYPNTLISMNNLAFTQKSLGYNIKVIQLMEKCLKLRN